MINCSCTFSAKNHHHSVFFLPQITFYDIILTSNSQGSESPPGSQPKPNAPPPAGQVPVPQQGQAQARKQSDKEMVSFQFHLILQKLF